MSSTTIKPPSGGKINRIGLPMANYKGGDSTLCAGCGHDAITSQIVRAFWEYGIEPHRLAKLSACGSRAICSPSAMIEMTKAGVAEASDTKWAGPE